MSEDLKKLSQDIWPQERDFISKPERYKYVRKLIKPDGCVFCKLENAEPSAESLLLYKSKNCMVLMNKYPYNNGHLLVIPKKHIGYLDELDKDIYMELSLLLKDSLSILKKAYETSTGVNLGMNQGDVAGAGIPDHLHWHLIPRWHGDTNFFPLIAETKVLPETHEQSFDKLYPYFKDL